MAVNPDASLPLITPRLTVRRLRVRDLSDFQAYRTDAELARYQGWDIESDEQARQFLSTMANAAGFVDGEWLQLGIQQRTGDQRLIGDIGIGWHGAGTAEIGYTLNRSCQGAGLATEAVSAVVGWLLDTFSLSCIAAITDVQNRASIRLLERLGFTRVRTVRNSDGVSEHHYEFRAGDYV